MQDYDNVPSILTSRFEAEMPRAPQRPPSRRLGSLVLLAAAALIVLLISVMLS